MKTSHKIIAFSFFIICITMPISLLFHEGIHCIQFYQRDIKIKNLTIDYKNIGFKLFVHGKVSRAEEDMLESEAWAWTYIFIFFFIVSTGYYGITKIEKGELYESKPE